MLAGLRMFHLHEITSGGILLIFHYLFGRVKWTHGNTLLGSFVMDVFLLLF
jgi:hypothetical protein